MLSSEVSTIPGGKNSKTGAEDSVWTGDSVMYVFTVSVVVSTLIDVSTTDCVWDDSSKPRKVSSKSSWIENLSVEAEKE